MQSIEILDTVLRLLEAAHSFIPMPGYDEVQSELSHLRERMSRRQHHRDHNGHSTETIDIAGVELTVDYTYTPPTNAGSAAGHDDPNFSVPPEDDELLVYHLWTRDDLRVLLEREYPFDEVHQKLLAVERKRGD